MARPKFSGGYRNPNFSSHLRLISRTQTAYVHLASKGHLPDLNLMLDMNCGLFYNFPNGKFG
jgi:hypothetical protein